MSGFPSHDSVNPAAAMLTMMILNPALICSLRMRCCVLCHRGVNDLMPRLWQMCSILVR